jgi:hypothetical protein
MKPHGTVSVVVSTYNRPDALLAALSSVRAQSYPIHEVIVVGDHCGPETARALETVNDPTVRFVNLERRHGDQSGPNFRGVAEASGDWVAFLNHDDFWFPNHIADSLDALERSGKLWFCGIALFSDMVSEKDGGVVPMVTELGLQHRRMSEAFGATLRYMEPASAWVVARNALERVGNWPFAGDSVRTPVSRIALLLWRRLGEPVWGVQASVLKVQGALQQKLGGEYNSPSPVHRELQTAMELAPTAWFEGLEFRLNPTTSRRDPLESNYPELSLEQISPMLLRFAALWFRVTGIDLLERRLRRHGARPGQIMDRILLGRTGEARDSSTGRFGRNRGDE